MGLLTVAASGQQLTVDIQTPAGHEESTFSDVNLATPITLPLAITADQDFYFVAGSHLVTVTVTTAASVVILSETVEVGTVDHVVLTPLPSRAQEAATDSAAPRGTSSLPNPEIGDAGKVPAVNEAETGYELAAPQVAPSVVGGAFYHWAAVPTGSTSLDWADATVATNPGIPPMAGVTFASGEAPQITTPGTYMMLGKFAFGAGDITAQSVELRDNGASYLDLYWNAPPIPPAQTLFEPTFSAVTEPTDFIIDAEHDSAGPSTLNVWVQIIQIAA